MMTPHEWLLLVILAACTLIAVWARIAYRIWWPLPDDDEPQPGLVLAPEWEAWEPAPTDRIARWVPPVLEGVVVAGPVPAAPDAFRWRDDLELLAWDARQQAARCWEILYIEFPKLRASLLAA